MEVIDEQDLANVKVDTDLEVRLMNKSNVYSLTADDVCAFKEELLEEKGSKEDKSRPLCFGPIRKQSKPKKNRARKNKPTTSEKLLGTISEPTVNESQDPNQVETPKAQSKRQRSVDNTPANTEKRPKTSGNSRQQDHVNQAAQVHFMNQVKRPMEDNQVKRANPLDQTRQPKKKQETYAEASSKDLNILVMDVNNGIIVDQVRTLEEKLMDVLDVFLESKPTTTPDFWASTYAFENVKYVCDNEYSVSWLKKAVNSMPPPWPGAELTAISMAEKSELKLNRKPTQKPQIKFFVPDGTKKKSYEAICKHIEQRNAPIKVQSWEMWKEEDVPNGTFYHVSTDEDTINEIQRKGGRLFYYFSTIKVIIPKGKSPEEEQL